MFVYLPSRGNKAFGNHYHTRSDCHKINNLTHLEKVDEHTAHFFGYSLCEQCRKITTFHRIKDLIVCKSSSESSAVIVFYGNEIRLRPGQFIQDIIDEPKMIPIEIRREWGLEDD